MSHSHPRSCSDEIASKRDRSQARAPPRPQGRAVGAMPAWSPPSARADRPVPPSRPQPSHVTPLFPEALRHLLTAGGWKTGPPARATRLHRAEPLAAPSARGSAALPSAADRGASCRVPCAGVRAVSVRCCRAPSCRARTAQLQHRGQRPPERPGPAPGRAPGGARPPGAGRARPGPPAARLLGLPSRSTAAGPGGQQRRMDRE